MIGRRGPDATTSRTGRTRCSAMRVAVLSREEVREIDRLAMEQYRIPGIVLMENAGRGCVDMLCQLGVQGPVAICCGRGNNAGDGLVIARHLDLRGYPVRLLFWSDPAELTGDAGLNYEIASCAALPLTVFRPPHDRAQLAQQLDGVDWVVDALLGTERRASRGPRWTWLSSN